MNKSPGQEAAEWGCAGIVFALIFVAVCLSLASLVTYAVGGLTGHELPYWPTFAATVLVLLLLQMIRGGSHK